MSTNTLHANRKLLRTAAVLLLLGVVLSFLAGNAHPSHAIANDHVAAFTEYAESTNWTAIHLGQFAGMAMLIVGMVVMFFALSLPASGIGWVGRLGLLWAVIALGLYGVLQAVDGVALKQAVNAWIHAPEAEKAARFATAEGIRWLEWAVRSYQSFTLGLSFLLLGITIAWTGRISKMIGCLMLISGFAYLAQGWVLGEEGFAASNTYPTLFGILSVLGWSIWLLISAWQMKEASEPDGNRLEYAHS